MDSTGGGAPGHTVTGRPGRRPAHAARPAPPARTVAAAIAAAVLAAAALAAAVTVLAGRNDSAPSSPTSAQRITAPPRAGLT